MCIRDSLHGAEERQLFSDEAVYSDVREPDGIQHAAGRFHDARWRIPIARLHRERLGDDATEAGDVHGIGTLITIALSLIHISEPTRPY